MPLRPMRLTAFLLLTGSVPLTSSPPLAARRARAQAPAPQVIDFTLDNGLRVLVDPRPSAQEVAVVLTVNAGSADDPPGLEGLAHLTEHLLFRGTPRAPLGTQAYLRAAGARVVNAQTFDEATRYLSVVPPGALERTLWLEAERFGFGVLAMSEEAFAQERRVVEREHVQRWGTGERRSAGSRARYLFGPEHRFARHPRSPRAYEALALDHARWFHQRHYRPDLAVLAITGPVNAAEVRRWVTRFFGPLRPHPAFPVRRRALPSPARRGDAQVPSPSGGTERLLLWPTPPWLAPGDAELDLVATALAEAMPVTPGLRFTAMQESHRVDSMFVVSMSGRDARLVAAAERRFLRELGRLQTSPVSTAVLRRLAERNAARVLTNADAPLNRAQRLASSAPTAWGGGPVTRPAELASRYRAVSAASLRSAARRWLATERRVRIHRSPGRP